MGDFAIFTKEVAEGLIERGFELIARTEKAYYFTDSVWLRVAVEELLEIIQEQSK